MGLPKRPRRPIICALRNSLARAIAALDMARGSRKAAVPCGRRIAVRRYTFVGDEAASATFGSSIAGDCASRPKRTPCQLLSWRCRSYARFPPTPRPHPTTAPMEDWGFTSNPGGLTPCDIEGSFMRRQHLARILYSPGAFLLPHLLWENLGARCLSLIFDPPSNGRSADLSSPPAQCIS